jgi:hypothetical protein
MSDISFKNKFTEFAKDQVIDKKELSELSNIAKNPNIKDKNLAKYVINDLNRFKDTTQLTYNIKDPLGKIEELKFIFSPTYTENELIPGKNILEIVSNISQSDNLTQTNDDGNRCGAGSLLNAYLIMGGDFATIAQKFSIDKELTYKNVHLMQEKIYDISNTDSKPGLESGFNYTYESNSGKIKNSSYDGELSETSKKLGIDIISLLGETSQSIYIRDKSVSEFMNANPKGVFQVGVHMDTETGDLFSPTDQKTQNHSVLVFKRDDKFYLADTGTTTNGAQNSLKEITNEQFSAFVKYTHGSVNALKMSN